MSLVTENSEVGVGRGVGQAIDCCFVLGVREDDETSSGILGVFVV